MLDMWTFDLVIEMLHMEYWIFSHYTEIFIFNERSELKFIFSALSQKFFVNVSIENKFEYKRYERNFMSILLRFDVINVWNVVNEWQIVIWNKSI